MLLLLVLLLLLSDCILVHHFTEFVLKYNSMLRFISCLSWVYSSVMLVIQFCLILLFSFKKRKEQKRKAIICVWYVYVGHLRCNVIPLRSDVQRASSRRQSRACGAWRCPAHRWPPARPSSQPLEVTLVKHLQAFRRTLQSSQPGDTGGNVKSKTSAGVQSSERSLTLQRQLNRAQTDETADVD